MRSAPEVTQAHADRVAAKLQTLYDSLSDDEKTVLRALVDQAEAANEVAGFKLGVPASSLVIHRKVVLGDGGGPDGPTIGFTAPGWITDDPGPAGGEDDLLNLNLGF